MFEQVTLESIQSQILDAIPESIDTREGSYTADLIAPAALEIWKVYQRLEALIPIAFVDETSGEYLDKRCEEYGIYRKQSKADVSLVFNGTDGSVIPKGTIAATESGLQYITLEEAVISGGAASVPAKSMEIGAKYNVSAGQITVLQNAIAGIVGVTNPQEAAGGADLESSKALYQRLQDRLQNPATSGNANHYHQWAMSAKGVGAAKVIPLANGNGTVKVLILDDQKEEPAKNVLDECKRVIEENRPIGASVSVESPDCIPIHVTADVSLDGTRSLAEVQNGFEDEIRRYVQSVALTEQNRLSLTRIGSILFDLEGVSDYDILSIKINQANQNWIAQSDDQAPVFGSVVLNLMEEETNG